MGELDMTDGIYQSQDYLNINDISGIDGNSPRGGSMRRDSNDGKGVYESV